MYKVSDITYVVCVRLHIGNEWVLDRLKIMQEYYNPSPKLLVIDFGSEHQYANEIEAVCESGGSQYVYIDDKGTYSAAIAHNRGFDAVDTELVFFSDVDFFFESDVFARLIKAANAAEMSKNFDVVLNFPAYHVRETYAESFFSKEGNQQRDAVLNKIALHAPYEKSNSDAVEFIAPYSNVYLIHKNFYSMIGGYNENFRGHGSEDFEFFIRLSKYAKNLPMPKDLVLDKYGPTKNDFFWTKQYTGFRRLNQLIALPAELMGFKAFHMWHPTGLDKDWRSENDWRRDKMRSVVDEYMKDDSKLLGIDFVTRNKKIVCICKHKEHYGYFLPLRVLGYELIPFYTDDANSLIKINQLIKNKSIDAYAIFNPYMKSHHAFYPSFLLAKEMGLKTIVIERGALPSSIYYSSDVCYSAKEFSQEAFDNYVMPNDDLIKVEAYIEKLKSGGFLLEKQSSYSETMDKYQSLKDLDKKKCLIPLQLDDDMAVTKFVRNAQSYSDFVNNINEAASKNKDVIFVVKKHPLSKKAISFNSENIVFVEPEDNIHCLLDIVDFTVCYNSGVGLLSLIHAVPTITVGNAFYNVNGTGDFSDDIERAVTEGKEKSAPDKDVVVKLLSFYLTRLYSFFEAKDDVKDFKHRKAHGYKDILITEFKLDGEIFHLNRFFSDIVSIDKSYAASTFNCKITFSDKRIVEDKNNKSFNDAKVVSSKSSDLNKFGLAKRRLKKLINNPYAYFNDSKHPSLRVLKKLFNKKR